MERQERRFDSFDATRAFAAAVSAVHFSLPIALAASKNLRGAGVVLEVTSPTLIFIAAIDMMRRRRHFNKKHV